MTVNMPATWTKLPPAGMQSKDVAILPFPMPGGSFAQDALEEDFQLVAHFQANPSENTYAVAFMRLAA